ncbi:MAG: multicopper oxidase domain-containing protein [Thermoprotei archaeon]
MLMNAEKVLSILAILLSITAITTSTYVLSVYPSQKVTTTPIEKPLISYLNIPPNTNFNITENDLMYLMDLKPAYAEIFIENNTIRFTHDKISIVVTAEPELGEEYEDRFVVFGLINPTLIIPVNANVKIIFINGGDSEFHSFSVIKTPPPYPSNLDSPEYMTFAFNGSSIPDPLRGIQFEKPSGIYHGTVIQFTADKPGTYYYVCHVGDHAHNGMFGQFIVK